MEISDWITTGLFSALFTAFIWNNRVFSKQITAKVDQIIKTLNDIQQTNVRHNEQIITLYNKASDQADKIHDMEKRVMKIEQRSYQCQNYKSNES